MERGATETSIRPRLRDPIPEKPPLLLCPMQPSLWSETLAKTKALVGYSACILPPPPRPPPPPSLCCGAWRGFLLSR